MTRSARFAFAFAVPLAACAAQSPSGSDGMGTGGTDAAGGTGGVTFMSGGSPASAGSKATGAAGLGGSTSASGGAATGGGSAGGPAAVGGTANGGGSPGSSGTPGLGGMPATGGTPGMGTSATGGMPATGGMTATGGVTATAGMTSMGGAPATPTDELPGSACTKEFTAPAFADLKTNAKMPDPFTFLDGTKVLTKDDWVCRQKEISVLAQAFIYGPKPPKPETFNATWSNGKLTLDMANAGQTWKLDVSITVPSGTGPFPAMFDVDAGVPSGVASIKVGLTFLTGIASAGSGRTISGKFYDFYPSSKKTGSLMAWAWLASRIVDGLQATTGHNIDATKLYGLGCSRNGKTAATMALFDQRIAMVGMQSPGSGTTSGWRIADAQTGSVQTADEIYGETTWMGEDFGQFGNAVNKLPIDQHEVLALAWPRPILVREGTNDSWNCPVCVYTTLKYTQLVYEALGSKDLVGFTHYNGGHCESGGQDWTDTYNAFLKHFILPADGTTSTAGFFDEKFTFDKAKWQDGELMAIP